MLMQTRSLWVLISKPLRIASPFVVGQRPARMLRSVVLKQKQNYYRNQKPLSPPFPIIRTSTIRIQQSKIMFDSIVNVTSTFPFGYSLHILFITSGESNRNRFSKTLLGRHRLLTQPLLDQYAINRSPGNFYVCSVLSRLFQTAL